VASLDRLRPLWQPAIWCCTVVFFYIFCYWEIKFEWNRRRSATKLAIVAGYWHSGHNLVDWPINAVSVVGRWRAATTNDGSSLSRTTCDLWRPSPVQCTAENWTQLNDPVQLSLPLCHSGLQKTNAKIIPKNDGHTHCPRPFRRRFYGSNDPTNSVIALKDDG